MIPILNGALIAAAFALSILAMLPKTQSVPDTQRRKIRLAIATACLFLGLVVNL